MGAAEVNSAEVDSTELGSAEVLQLAGYGEEEVLLAAIRAVFERRNGQEFREQADRLIEGKKEAMVQVCKRNRLQVESGINELLMGREALMDVSASLRQASSQATKLEAANLEARTKLIDCITVKSNLECALAVVKAARRLVMIRARAASSSNAGRLHSGMQLISVLQKESTTAHSKYVDALKARKPSLVSRYAPVGERIFLAEVLPDPHELIADARAKEKAIFRGFQSYLRTITEDIGRYALAHDEFNGWLPEVPEDLDEEENESGTAAAPRLIVRPLLSCLLVQGDMDRLVEFCAHYGKLRRRQFDSNLYIYPNAELSRVEANLACVVGFFVVEITISKYVSASPTTSKCVGPGGLLSMSELVQWWTDAQRRLVSSLDGLEYSNPTDNTRVRSLVDRFIRCLMSYNIKSPKMDEWL